MTPEDSLAPSIPRGETLATRRVWDRRKRELMWPEEEERLEVRRALAAPKVEEKEKSWQQSKGSYAVNN